MMMFNWNGHLDRERKAVRNGGEIQRKIRAACGKSGLSRRPGLAFKDTAITAGPVMRNHIKGGT
jgi:hypothetical protein